jgi:hypothetical protein
VHRARGAVQRAELRGQLGALAAEFLRAVGLGPDRRIFEFAAYFFEAFLLFVVLKETPLRRRGDPRDPSVCA